MYRSTTPVMTNIWIRPNLQKQQFELLRKAKPEILIVQSDGGRNQTEWDAIKEGRNLFDNEIDWPCQLHRLYSEKNLGLYSMLALARDYVWSNFDTCIFLEDDDMPSVSFFRFCEEMLERYARDTRISYVSGNNPLADEMDVPADYIFSCLSSINGTATWKRFADVNYFDIDTCIDNISGLDDYYLSRMKMLCDHDGYNFWDRHLKEMYETGLDNNHIAGREFAIAYSRYAHYQLQIVPKRNLTVNKGVGKDAAHAAPLEETPKALRKLYIQESCEIDFPITHPQLVVRDLDFEKKYAELIDLSGKKAWIRSLESLWLAMSHGDWERIRNKFDEKVVHINTHYEK